MDGIVTYRLDDWADFFQLLESEILPSIGPGKSPRIVWRGQRRDDWSLITSLDRLFERRGLLSQPPDDLEILSQKHLENFRRAARGRRGANPPKLDANEWWALGQHYGLATPLLDWTRSPFAAAYFAFEEDVPESERTKSRIVFGLNQDAVDLRNLELVEGSSIEDGRAAIIQFFDPFSDENPRLVSQGGLFTRAPIGKSVELWVAEAFEGLESPVLTRVEVPDESRDRCLHTLDRMNINHLSLFPDLSGASRYANLALELEL